MRSVWKGPFIDNRVLNEIYELHKANKKKAPVKIMTKNSVIFPSFVGLTFFIFNGKKFFTNGFVVLVFELGPDTNICNVEVCCIVQLEVNTGLIFTKF